jgi:UDPglucose 6-dehydrogenase
MKLAVVGLGKLGLPLVAVLAGSGHKTHGYDKNLEHIERLNAGIYNFEEPGLNEILEANKVRTQFGNDILQVCKGAKVIFVIVPTPSNSEGKFSNDAIIEVLKNVSQTIKDSDSFQIINIVSTVMPGSCKEVFIPLIEEISGKKCGVDFGLTYNPEFIALGSVIKNMKYPDMHLIGASDLISGQVVLEIMSGFVLNSPESRIMNLTEAELVKISVNNFVTMKISFANMMMQICESFRGTNVDVVTEAIGLDSRIGSRYLKAGTSFGGPCFPRDTRALDNVLQEAGIEQSIPAAVDQMNIAHSRYISERILSLVKNSDKNVIALIGLAYKEDTRVTEESASLNLAGQLANYSGRVIGWDPIIKETQPDFPSKLEVIANLHETLSEGVTIVVLRLLSTEDRAHFSNLDDDKVIFDPWRQFSKEDIGNAQLVQPGKS